MEFQLTEKNAAKVMQVINTFFSKSAFEFFKDVERVKFEVNGLDLKQHKTIQDEYQPIFGVTCQKHPLYNQVPSKLYPKRPVFLFVISKYHDSGLSLYAGDIVIDHGNRLVIKTQTHYRNDNTNTDCSEWYERTFVQGEISDEVRQKEISDTFSRTSHEFMLECFETTNIERLDDDYVVGFDSVSEFISKIDKKTQFFMNSEEFVKEALVFEDANHKIYFIRDYQLFEEVGFTGDIKRLVFFRVVDKDGNLIIDTDNFYDLVYKVATHVEPTEY